MCTINKGFHISAMVLFSYEFIYEMGARCVVQVDLRLLGSSWEAGALNSAPPACAVSFTGYSQPAPYPQGYNLNGGKDKIIIKEFICFSV